MEAETPKMETSSQADPNPESDTERDCHAHTQHYAKLYTDRNPVTYRDSEHNADGISDALWHAYSFADFKRQSDPNFDPFGHAKSYANTVRQMEDARVRCADEGRGASDGSQPESN